MLITFKSKAYADILMFGDVAMRLMELMEKIPAEQGIITEEQLPIAIAGLRAAIAEDKRLRAEAQAQEWKEQDKLRDEGEPEEEKKKPKIEPGVSIGQRATPLLELLERSLKQKVPVIWGS